MAYQLKVTLPRFLAVMIVLVTVLFAVPHAAASEAITLNGSFAYFLTPQTTLSTCDSGIADGCGIIQMDGLGAADWTYTYGPTAEPTGENGCFYENGTFTLTLHSDGSTITGASTGVFCRQISDAARHHESYNSHGNPWVQDDTIQLMDGTGQFAGLYGTALLHTWSYGAVFDGTLTGTLGN